MIENSLKNIFIGMCMISTYFFFIVPNVLIATGGPHSTEIFNLLSDFFTCSDFGDYPIKSLSGAVGSSLGSIPVICGGRVLESLEPSIDKCYGYIQNQWQEFAIMTQGKILLLLGSLPNKSSKTLSGHIVLV